MAAAPDAPKVRRVPASQRGRMQLALRDAERTMCAIRDAGFAGDAAESWRPAKAWLEKHAALLASLSEYE